VGHGPVGRGREGALCIRAQLAKSTLLLFSMRQEIP
jgi:hypothetical protein